MISDKKGFTILEILVALGIMAIGFLAMSQMQYLSLRQTTIAQVGTQSTNFIQAIADRDSQMVKSIHLLNSRIFLDSQSRKTIITQDDYCDGNPPTDCLHPPCEDPCSLCPCNPLDVYTSNSNADNVETTCAFLSTTEFDPTNVNFETNKALCTDPPCATADPPCERDLFLVRRVVTTVDQTTTPPEIDLSIIYAIKTLDQFTDFELDDPIRLFNTVVTQTYNSSAHIQDWSDTITIPGQDWTNTFVPHIP